jgi:hypothetical protein
VFSESRGMEIKGSDLAAGSLKESVGTRRESYCAIAECVVLVSNL